MARANWTPRMEICLVGVLVKQAREGKCAENGFKQEAWVVAQGELNTINGVFWILPR